MINIKKLNLGINYKITDEGIKNMFAIEELNLFLNN